MLDRTFHGDHMPAKFTPPAVQTSTRATTHEPKRTYISPYVVQLTSAPTTGGRKGIVGPERGTTTSPS
jgi:hypothetical protein